MIAGNAILLVSSIAPHQRLRHRRLGMRLYPVIESALGGFWQDFPEDLALFLNGSPAIWTEHENWVMSGWPTNQAQPESKTLRRFSGPILGARVKTD
jgi:hypothetical protein